MSAQAAKLEDAREKLRSLLKQSREALDSSKSKPAPPSHSFQFTEAPRNVSVSVRSFNPKGNNEDPLFLPIIAETRHRRRLRRPVTVIEITSTDESGEEFVIEPPTTQKEIIKESPAPPENQEAKEEVTKENEATSASSVDEMPKEETKAPSKEEESDEDSSEEVIMPQIPKAPVTWPETPAQVDPESAKTAQDKEWWDDEILKCAIAQLKEELTEEQRQGILVYSPLEAVSLLYHGEIESPPSNIKRIFLPLHVDGTHWCLLEISASSDRQTLYVTLFDSLPLLNTAEWFQFRWQEVNRAIEGLARCKVFTKLGWRVKNMELARVDRRQTNIYDCGPYTVEFLKKRVLDEKGDSVSAFEAAMRRETVKDWLESDEVDVPMDKATVERIKAETEVIEPSKNLVQVKSRLRGRLSALFDS